MERARTTFSMLLAIALLPCAASAQGGPALDLAQEYEAAVLLDVGQRLAGEGRCELAIVRFRRVLTLDPADPMARFHLGACLHAVGRDAEAVPMLESYFARVDRQVDPERDEIAARVLEAARAASAALAVIVVPEGAFVTVDGRPLLGAGERSVRVDPGRHVIRAELEGWTTRVSDVDIAPGERALELVQLLPVARPEARLEITTDPPGAFVAIDGHRVSSSLGANAGVDLAAGRHRVTVSAPGHERREREIYVVDGDQLHLDITLAPEPVNATLAILGPVLAVVAVTVLGSAIGIGIIASQ